MRDADTEDCRFESSILLTDPSSLIMPRVASIVARTDTTAANARNPGAAAAEEAAIE